MIVSFQSLTERSAAGMAKFGYYIAEILHKNGLLEAFVVHSKGKFETPFPSLPVSFLSRYYLRLLNSFSGFLPLKQHQMRLLQETLFDIFCSRRLRKTTKVLVVTVPFLKRTFRKAKRMGMTIVFIPGTAEENFINKIVVEEQKHTGVYGEDAYTHQPRLDYYNESMQFVDIVAAPFSVIFETYKASRFTGETKALLGYLKPEIKRAQPEHLDSVFRVGYLAHTVLLKGVHYLLKAWKELSDEGLLRPDMELLIAGGMDPNMERFVKEQFPDLPQVVYTGHTHQVSQFYCSLSLFVVPSLTDGTPYTAIEAAMHDVPVVLTENCGTKDFLNGMEKGCLVVPIRDATAIKKEILAAYNSKEAFVALGKAGGRAVASYDPNAYVHNIVGYLQSLNDA